MAGDVSPVAMFTFYTSPLSETEWVSQNRNLGLGIRIPFDHVGILNTPGKYVQSEAMMCCFISQIFELFLHWVPWSHIIYWILQKNMFYQKQKILCCTIFNWVPLSHLRPTGFTRFFCVLRRQLYHPPRARLLFCTASKKQTKYDFRS